MGLDAVLLVGLPAGSKGVAPSAVTQGSGPTLLSAASVLTFVHVFLARARWLRAEDCASSPPGTRQPQCSPLTRPLESLGQALGRARLFEFHQPASDYLVTLRIELLSSYSLGSMPVSASALLKTPTASSQTLLVSAAVCGCSRSPVWLAMRPSECVQSRASPSSNYRAARSDRRAAPHEARSRSLSSSCQATTSR